MRVRDPLQRASGSSRRGRPHQEYRINAIQTSIQGLVKSEISAYHINMCRQTSRKRVARQRADSHARGRQLRENLAAHGASGADDEDSLHADILPEEVHLKSRDTFA